MRLMFEQWFQFELNLHFTDYKCGVLKHGSYFPKDLLDYLFSDLKI